jgi:hypothetical protein
MLVCFDGAKGKSKAHSGEARRHVTTIIPLLLSPTPYKPPREPKADEQIDFRPRASPLAARATTSTIASLPSNFSQKISEISKKKFIPRVLANLLLCPLFQLCAREFCG